MASFVVARQCKWGKNLGNIEKDLPMHQLFIIPHNTAYMQWPVVEAPGRMGLGNLDMATPELAQLDSKGSLETPAQTAAH